MSFTVHRDLVKFLPFGQSPRCPGPTCAEKRMPKPCCGFDTHESRCSNGTGTGRLLIQNSGHAAWKECVSLAMSNATVPVRPAKSNGCFGYMAREVTLPA